MQFANLCSQLNRLFTPNLTTGVITCLRQDPLTWEAVQDPAFLSQVVTRLGDAPDRWSPANLALIAIGAEETAAELCSLPMATLNADLRQKAAQTYEQTIHSGQPPQTLAQAGLLALALREGRRLKGSWQWMEVIFSLRGTARLPFHYAVWRSPIACLVGMVPDPFELCKVVTGRYAIAPSTEQAAAVIHAFGAHPFSPAERSSLMARLVGEFNPPEQLNWLHLLKHYGHTGLARQLAHDLLTMPRNQAYFSNQIEAQDPAAPTSNADPLETAQALSAIAALEEQAAFLHTAGQTEKALPILARAANLLRLHQARLAATSLLLQPGLDKNRALEGWEAAVSTAPESNRLRGHLAEALASANRLEDARAALQSSAAHPNNDRVAARLDFLSGRLAEAKTRAQLMVAAGSRAGAGAFSRIWNGDLNMVFQQVDLLLALGLDSEAQQVLKQALDTRPNEIALLEKLADIQAQTRQLQSAIDSLQLLAVLDPTQLDYHRRLAHLYDETFQDQRCHEEYQYLLSCSKEPVEADLRTAAVVALRVRQTQAAARASQKLLDKNSEDGLAMAYLGEALFLQGDIAVALGHLTQATFLSPDHPHPWLALARVQSEMGDKAKAFETLRTAALAAPHSPEILLAMGEACRKKNAPSEALPYLRDAAAIEPDSPRVILPLAWTLYNLGRFSEALPALVQARKSSPEHPEMALLHARVLLALDEKEAALPALQMANRGQFTQALPYVQLAETIRDLHSPRLNDSPCGGSAPENNSPDYPQAVAALRRALELEPGLASAQVLLAEMLYLTGEVQPAYDQFCKLAETPLSGDPHFHWRIQYGLGRSALDLGQTDTALAALQDAAYTRPDHLDIHRCLAFAFHKSSLPNEALAAARQALRMDPVDFTNLTWFADLVQELGYLPEAVTALEKAIQIAPGRANLQLQAARIHLAAGNPTEARAFLDRVAALPAATISELQSAAHLYGRLNSLPKALACLEKAVENCPAPSVNLLHDLAGAYLQSGSTSNALTAVERALLAQPENPRLLFLQAVLQERLGDNDRALYSLGQVLKGIPENPSASPQNGAASPFHTQLPELPDIHARASALQRQADRLNDALYSARQALDARETDLNLRFQAADLALALADLETVSSLIPSDLLLLPEDPSRPQDLMLALHCLKAETHLQKAELALAAQILDRALILNPEEPWVLALLARLNACQNGSGSGLTFLAHASKNSSPALLNNSENPPLDRNRALALAGAALELQQWRLASSLFQKTAGLYPEEPWTNLQLARCLVICAENQFIYQSLKAGAHAPSENALSADATALFEKAILVASRAADITAPSHWRARGQAIFHPSAQVARTLEYHLYGADDAAALVAVLWKIGSLVEAKNTASTFQSRITGSLRASSSRVLFQLGVSAMLTAPATSLEAARAILQMEPENPLYNALLAFIAQDDTITALAAIETALTAWPEEAEWHHLAAELASRLNQAGKAIEHWREVVKLSPDNPWFTISLGNAYLENHNYAEAIQAFEQALRLDASITEAWLYLSRAYRLAGSLDDSLRCAGQVLAAAPTHMDALLMFAAVALETGRCDLALEKANAALNLQPDLLDATLVKAEALARGGKPAEALRFIDHSLVSFPGDADLLLLRARLSRKQNGPHVALSQFKELAARFPNRADILAPLAEVHAELGQAREAETVARSALQADATYNHLHLLLGRLQRGQGQLDQAIFHLGESIRLAPAQVEAYLELGRVYQDRRDYPHALEIYRKAIQVAPLDPQAYFQAGIILRHNKDYVNAEAMFRLAAKYAPDDVNIHRQLGAIIALNLVHNPQEASVKL